MLKHCDRQIYLVEVYGIDLLYNLMSNIIYYCVKKKSYDPVFRGCKILVVKQLPNVRQEWNVGK